MSMKNSSGTIGNPTRDLPDCSALPKVMGGCFLQDRKKEEIWAKNLAPIQHTIYD